MTTTRTSCAVCGASTLGFIVTVQGGTRVLSVGTRDSRKLYCKKHGYERIAQLRAAEVKRTGQYR